VRNHLDEIRQAGANVLIVTQSRPEAVAAMSLSQPILCDPERAAYRYFGLDRGRWSMYFRSGVLLRYLRLIFTGWRPHRGEAEEDMLQLGGDFILSSDRRLVYAYRSNDPADRPTARVLVDQVQQLARAHADRVLSAAKVAKSPASTNRIAR
jgi:AhpC/TSA antioxidant enzyme